MPCGDWIKIMIKHLSNPSEFDDQTNMRIVWGWHNILMGILTALCLRLPAGFGTHTKQWRREKWQNTKQDILFDCILYSS